MNRATIKKQRQALGLKPWQFCPAEVDFGACPYPVGTVGFVSWHEAVAMKREMQKARDNDDDAA